MMLIWNYIVKIVIFPKISLNKWVYEDGYFKTVVKKTEKRVQDSKYPNDDSKNQLFNPTGC